jgi:hypothetical protein
MGAAGHYLDRRGGLVLEMLVIQDGIIIDLVLDHAL